MHALAVIPFPFPFAQQSDRKSVMSFQWGLISMNAHMCKRELKAEMLQATNAVALEVGV